MSADILSDPTHPHGTTEGFARGCRGAHCPARITCRTVHFRYHGDYSFRRAIDTGMTPEQVLEQEEAARKPARPQPTSEDVRRWNDARNERRASERRTDAPTRVPSTDYQKRVARLVLEKQMTDREIADELHRTRLQIAAVRKYLGLRPNLTDRTPAPAGVSSSQGSA